MKKAGFKSHIAGGIERAASIGGMFMPPIMGAGGFIMAELTGMPYSKIMLVVLFPALMFFFSVFMMVHYYAKKEKIVGERYPKTALEIERTEWIYTMPLGDHSSDAERILTRIFCGDRTGNLRCSQF